MATFIPFNRDQAFLLLPDRKAWLAGDDLAHFVVAAVERVPLGAFDVAARPGGKPQHHLGLMLTLLVHSYANAIFSSRRIERATCRDIAMRFVAANLHSATIRSRPCVEPARPRSRRRSCKFCCWRARPGCCGWRRRLARAAKPKQFEQRADAPVRRA